MGGVVVQEVGLGGVCVPTAVVPAVQGDLEHMACALRGYVYVYIYIYGQEGLC